MDTMDLLQLLPQTIQHDIIDFHDCKLKDGRDATRITLSRMLTAEEKSQMSGEHFVGINCIAHYRYAPENRKILFLCCIVKYLTTKVTSLGCAD